MQGEMVNNNSKEHPYNSNNYRNPREITLQSNLSAFSPERQGNYTSRMEGSYDKLPKINASNSKSALKMNS